MKVQIILKQQNLSKFVTRKEPIKLLGLGLGLGLGLEPTKQLKQKRGPELSNKRDDSYGILEMTSSPSKLVSYPLNCGSWALLQSNPNPNPNFNSTTSSATNPNSNSTPNSTPNSIPNSYPNLLQSLDKGTPMLDVVVLFNVTVDKSMCDVRNVQVSVKVRVRVRVRVSYYYHFNYT
jgi:hypothetical protein